MAEPDAANAPETEAFDPRLAALDTWPAPLVLQALWEGQLAAVAAIGPALPALARAAEAATARLRASATGRLAYAGAGTSARLAAGDGAELAPTFDWPEARLLLLPAGGTAALAHAVENAEDDRAAAAEAVRRHALGPLDVLVGVAASGATPFTVEAVARARAAGALTVGLANSPGSPLLDAAEHPVAIATGAEPIAGSTRMKAGTAQKIALTMLSTAVMVGLGRVHGGRMVDMRPRNAKLRRRAQAMVVEFGRVDPARASACLDAADGDVKRAILLARGLTASQAIEALARAGGILRRALAEAEGPS